MRLLDKRILNYIIIASLTFVTFAWTFWIFHRPFRLDVPLTVVLLRIVASTFVYKDYSLSWSKATQKTFLIKSIVNFVAFFLYAPLFYGKVHLYFLLSELFLYLFTLNAMVYIYYYFTNPPHTKTKNKRLVIFGAGKAGAKLLSEFRTSPYKVVAFLDDNTALHGRSIDGIPIFSPKRFVKEAENTRYDLLVIAIPTAPTERIRTLYENLSPYFDRIKILPPFDETMHDNPYTSRLKEISVNDLLARRPKDLDTGRIRDFVKGKSVLITGAGGSIGSELAKQCLLFGAKQLILLDHCEYSLYILEESLSTRNAVYIMQSVTDAEAIREIMVRYRPQIVIHAAAYKHVPIVESNPCAAIKNNILGTQNVIDAAVQANVKSCILISTDKAVRPSNIMGATKRICELYAQNVPSRNTEIVTVRFGNVLESSGSVIPKFKAQIAAGGPVTVTHPEVTRYFMLKSEACRLVLQAAAIGKGGEIFILDMGKPVKILDLAKKMIRLSGKTDVSIVFTGLRPGEKLHEELYLDTHALRTIYDSITVASPTPYDIVRLKEAIAQLILCCDDPFDTLHEILPENTPTPHRTPDHK